MSEKRASTSGQIHKLLAKRSHPYAFQDRSVGQDCSNTGILYVNLQMKNTESFV